ncbi:PAS domain S-box protein [Candidatus Omnitrophota bacterium]
MSEPKKNSFFRFLSHNNPTPQSKPQNTQNTELSAAQEGKHVEETYDMLERAVEQSIDGIAMADMEGNIKFCNRSWAKMHGYEIYEVLGKNLSIFHTGEQLEREVLPFHELVKKNGAHSGEVGHMRKNGTVFSTRMTTTLLKDEKGKPLGFVGIGRDITERKRIKKALIASEEKYRRLFEDSIEGIGIFKEDHFVTANKTLLDIFGYSDSNEFIRIPFIYHVALESRSIFRVKMREWTRGEFSDSRFEYKIIRSDGRIRDIEVSVTQLMLKNEKCIQGTFRDITDRKKTEESLRESEEKYRLLFDNNNEPVTIYDLEGNILLVNSSGARNLGGRPDDFVDKSLFELLPEMVGPIKKRIKQVVETGAGCDFEDLVELPNGEERWFWTNHQPVRDHNGNIFAIQTISRDITVRKRAHERQDTITAGLRAVVEMADKLIACPDLDSLFLRAVELGRERLGLERCAIFVEEDGQVRGFYGTDRYGRTTDEHALRFEKNEYWAKHLRKLGPGDPKWIKVEGPRLEWDGKKTLEIDRGWIALTPIQSAHRPIGVFVNDTAISKSEFDEVEQETLSVFCSLLGNIAERKRVEKELVVANKELFRSNKRFKQLTFRDSHTGVYNHRYLQEVIESEFSRARRYGFPLSVIMLDLDYFKSINDAYSHQFGDLVLKQFARRLKRMMRKYDTIIRFGGEEFLILSPGIDKATALKLSQKILNSITSASFGNEKFDVKLKLSLAVASFPENIVAKGVDLIELVDKILNKAKEDGGNRVYSNSDTKISTHPLLEVDDESSDVEFLRTKITKLNRKANQSLIESVFAFARTIKLKDQYTGEHVENTVCFATEIANKLGLSKNEIEHVKRASMLHDLGKIGVSENILLKKSKLSLKEFERIKKHPQIGADILRPIHSLHGIIPLVLCHHERWDGMGYPRGLKREEIPLGARIVAIADVYQALISDRPYRKAFTKEKARQIIREGSGSQFDPAITGLFLEVIE